MVGKFPHQTPPLPNLRIGSSSFQTSAISPASRSRRLVAVVCYGKYLAVAGSGLAVLLIALPIDFICNRNPLAIQTVTRTASPLRRNSQTNNSRDSKGEPLSWAQARRSPVTSERRRHRPPVRGLTRSRGSAGGCRGRRRPTRPAAGFGRTRGRSAGAGRGARG